MYLNWQLHAKKHTNLLEWLPPQNTSERFHSTGLRLLISIKLEDTRSSVKYDFDWRVFGYAR